MDLLIDDRRIQNPEPFPQPQPFSTFTAAAGNLVPSTLPVPNPPTDEDFASFRGFPPQKLRPIRGNPRSPSSSQLRNENQLGLSHLHSNAIEMDGTFDKLGVLVNEVCADGGDYFGLSPDEVNCVGIGRSIGGCERQCSARDRSPGDGSGSGRKKQNVEANSEGGVCQNESSSSSDDEDSSASMKEGTGRKRKRKTREKLEQFVERLAMKVMEKQEQLHAQLMEMLERKERERIKREEAWKQQELERLNREEAVRAQGISHNLAFISFIQKAIGNNGGEIPQPVLPVVNDQAKEGCFSPSESEYSCDASSKRWSDAEVQTLIMLRTSFEQKFRVMGYSCSLVWDEVSAGMQNMGYNRSGKECREKWKNMEEKE
ncbi:Trihelix transcription factor GT-2 [Linum perenne]